MLRRVCTIGKSGIDGIDGLYVHSVIRGVMCGGELGSVLTNHRPPPKLCSAGTVTTALQGYEQGRGPDVTTHHGQHMLSRL